MAEALALFERFSARSKTQETREWSRRDLNLRAKLETPRRIKDPCSWNISQYGGFRSVCPSKGQTASSAILDAASRSRSDAAHRALLESACTPIFRSAMEEHGQHTLIIRIAKEYSRYAPRCQTRQRAVWLQVRSKH